MIDVKMLCLGSLMGRDASGYDIKKDLERGSSSGLIEASFGSIYPALARLAEDGYIAARSEGGRGRGDKKVYTLTPQGRAYFLRTLAGPLPDEKYRSPFMFAMLFAECLPAERVRAMVDRQIESWEDKLLAAAESVAACPETPGMTFVHGLGDTMIRAGLDYIRRHRHLAEASALPTPIEPAGERPASRDEPAPAFALPD